MEKTKDIIDHGKKALGLTKVSEGITSMVQKLLGSHGLTEIDILKNWEKIVGSDLAKMSVPQRIDFKKNERSDGTLFLVTSSGAFALEIGHRTNMIIEKINTYFGYKAVSKIKIIQAGDEFMKESMNFADIEKKKLVTKEEENYIEQISRGIKDTALKERLESLALRMIDNEKKEN